VSPDRLRFDFNHVSAMTREELAEVERRVNAAIMADRPLTVKHCSYDQAIADGAVALFGEKYADDVRVVSIEGDSAELCGGTHLARTGQAGCFTILSESGVAAGVRRIEAATGWNALAEFNSRRVELEEAWPLLKSRPGELPRRIQALQEEARTMRKQLEKTAAKAVSGTGKDLMDSVEEINGIRVLTSRTAAPGMKALREIADDVRSKMPSGVIALTAEDDEGKVSMLVAVTRDLHARFTAPALIKEAAAAIGGSGGGRPDMAQAGGNNPAGIDTAFAVLKKQLQ
jgi:alanyl-tRNA synthetase